MAETKKFLDYAGLQHFVEKLYARGFKGMGLSQQNFTTELLNKLNSTATAEGLSQLTEQVNQLSALIEADSDGAINKFNEIVTFLNGIEDSKTLDGMMGDIATQLGNKVDKVPNKVLSTNDYTTAEKTKLAGIEEGAQKNTVTSVAGKTGVVSLVKGDVGLNNVDNTADADKPISTAVQAALDGKANAADIPAELPNPEALTITFNGSTEEGTGKFTYDGTAAKTVNITAASVGAMTAAQLKAVTFAAGKFAAKSYTPTAAATVNVPTNTSHLTNDSGFITADAVPTMVAVTNDEIDALIAGE